jgi:hypothetical protein
MLLLNPFANRVCALRIWETLLWRLSTGWRRDKASLEIVAELRYRTHVIIGPRAFIERLHLITCLEYFTYPLSKI